MMLVLALVEDDAVILGLEPLHGVLLDQLVRSAHAAGLLPPVPDVHAGSAQHHVEVHAINTDRRVVFDTQVDVFLDSEAEVAVGTEVLTAQLVLKHF